MGTHAQWDSVAVTATKVLEAGPKLSSAITDACSMLSTRQAMANPQISSVIGSGKDGFSVSTNGIAVQSVNNGLANDTPLSR